MRKPTIKSTGLLFSAASLTLATLSTLPQAHALDYDGNNISYNQDTVGFNGPVGSDYSLTTDVKDNQTVHHISGGYSDGAVLHSNGFYIDLWYNTQYTESHLFVANSIAAHGGLIIEKGSVLTTDFTTIGNEYQSNGYVTVTGAELGGSGGRSTWISMDSTYIGSSNGGVMPSDAQNADGAMGTINIVDNGEFIAQANVYVGSDGNGVINVDNGGALTAIDTSIIVGRAKGNGAINIHNGGVLTLEGSDMMIGQQTPLHPAGQGSLNIGAGGRVIQTGTANYSDPMITFDETSTLTVELSPGMVNTIDAFVTAVNIRLNAHSKLKVKTGGVIFTVGDEFILFSTTDSFSQEPFSFIDTAVSVVDGQQSFTFELRNNGLDLVLVAGAPIPEPSTYALLGGVGAVALALARRRRCRR